MSKTNKPAPAKMPHDYYLGLILKMAAAANVELSEATLAVYLERLSKLTKPQMDQATSRTIEEWQESSKMPTLAFILERSYIQPAMVTAQELERRYRSLIKNDA